MTWKMLFVFKINHFILFIQDTRFHPSFTSSSFQPNDGLCFRDNGFLTWSLVLKNINQEKFWRKKKQKRWSWNSSWRWGSVYMCHLQDEFLFTMMVLCVWAFIKSSSILFIASHASHSEMFFHVNTNKALISICYPLSEVYLLKTRLHAWQDIQYARWLTDHKMWRHLLEHWQQHVTFWCTHDDRYLSLSGFTCNRNPLNNHPMTMNTTSADYPMIAFVLLLILFLFSKILEFLWP